MSSYLLLKCKLVLSITLLFLKAEQSGVFLLPEVFHVGIFLLPRSKGHVSHYPKGNYNGILRAELAWLGQKRWPCQYKMQSRKNTFHETVSFQSPLRLMGHQHFEKKVNTFTFFLDIYQCGQEESQRAEWKKIFLCLSRHQVESLQVSYLKIEFRLIKKNHPSEGVHFLR